MGELLAGIDLVEDGLDLCIGVVFSIELLDAVVGEFAAHGCEEVVACLDGVDVVVEAVDGLAAHVGELIDVCLEVGGVLYSHRLVGTPCGEHLGGHRGVGSHLLVVLEGIDGIVGGADHLDVVVLHQAARGELGVVLDLLVARVEDFTGILRIEGLVDAKRRLQLQMSPVVEGIAEAVGECLSPLFELFPVGSVLACAEPFCHPIAAHGSPFVVVAAQPDLGDGFKTLVFSHLLRNQVAVIVNDRHLGRMFVIQLLCRFALQQEVLVHKRFHVL